MGGRVYDRIAHNNDMHYVGEYEERRVATQVDFDRGSQPLSLFVLG